MDIMTRNCFCQMLQWQPGASHIEKIIRSDQLVQSVFLSEGCGQTWWEYEASGPRKVTLMDDSIPFKRGDQLYICISCRGRRREEEEKYSMRVKEIELDFVVAFFVFRLREGTQRRQRKSPHEAKIFPYFHAPNFNSLIQQQHSLRCDAESACLQQ